VATSNVRACAEVYARRARARTRDELVRAAAQRDEIGSGLRANRPAVEGQMRGVSARDFDLHEGTWGGDETIAIARVQNARR